MRTLTFLFLLSGLVAVHEFGHAAAMASRGVTVEELGFGFGPLLYSGTTKGGLTLSLRAIPFGGYTRPAEKGPASMETATPASRIIICVAGPFVNAVLAFLAFVLFCRRGGTVPGWGGRAFRWAGPMLRPFAAGGTIAFGTFLISPIFLLILFVRHGFSAFRMFVGPIGMLFGTGADAPSDPKETVTIRDGTDFLLWNTFVLGIGLMVANMQPLYPLDGGQAAAAVVEAMGEDVKAFTTASFIGFLLFMALIFGLDLFRLARSGRSKKKE